MWISFKAFNVPLLSKANRADPNNQNPDHDPDLNMDKQLFNLTLFQPQAFSNLILKLLYLIDVVNVIFEPLPMKKMSCSPFVNNFDVSLKALVSVCR